MDKEDVVCIHTHTHTHTHTLEYYSVAHTKNETQMDLENIRLMK